MLTTRLGRLRAYFLQGHMRFFTIIIRLIADSTIIYALLFQYFEWIYEVFPNYFIFLGVFAPTYFCACVILGYFDFSRKVYHGEGSLFFQPIYDYLDQKFQEIAK